MTRINDINDTNEIVDNEIVNVEAVDVVEKVGNPEAKRVRVTESRESRCDVCKGSGRGVPVTPNQPVQCDVCVGTGLSK